MEMLYKIVTSTKNIITLECNVSVSIKITTAYNF